MATDKDGTQYFFGTEGTKGSTLAYRKSTSDGCQWRFKIYKLYKVQDVYSNTMEISYDNKEAGTQYCGSGDKPIAQSYPSVISYTTNAVAGDSHVEYTIEFTTTSKGYNPIVNQRYGDGAFLLDEIGMYYHPTSGSKQLIRTVDLGHIEVTHANNNGRKTKLLDRLTLKGTDGTALPDTEFEYQWEEIAAFWRSPEKDKSTGHYHQHPHNPHWDRPFLTKIANNYGGETGFAYKVHPTDSFFQVVDTRTITDVINSLTGTYTYTFTSPNQDTDDGIRSFASFHGFGQAKVEDPQGNISEHDFDTDKDGLFNGRQLETRRYDADGDLYTLSKPTYAKQARPGTALEFPYISEQRSYLCNGQTKTDLSKCVLSFVTFEVDGWGNPTRQVEYTDNGTKVYRTTDRGFHTKTGSKWLHKRRNVDIYPGATISEANLEASTWFSYDDQPNVLTATNVALGDKGELTAVRYWTGSISNLEFVDVRYGYDSRGVQTTETRYDGLGSQTAYASDNPQLIITRYDTGGLLPIEVENALSQTVETEFDYRFQLPKTTTDTNDAVTNYDYDVFGRLTDVTLPGCSDIAFKASYGDNEYTPATPKPYFEKSSQNIADCDDDALYVDAYVFYDGLGRRIQSQSADDATGGLDAIINDARYDTLGRVDRNSVSYEKLAVLGTHQDPNWHAYTATAYDPLGRPLKITTPDMSDTELFYDRDITGTGYIKTDLNLVSITDANGHAKHEVTDTFGNLIRVREFTGTALTGPHTYTFYAETEYAYDVRDNLVKVTDQDNNETDIVFDALNRKTSMDDPDMGVWSYKYDSLGNLTQQTDANTDRTCFYYDDLNRVTVKDYQGGDCGATPPASPFATYEYDLGTNGIGRRTAMTDTVGTVNWIYDARGRLITDTRTLNSSYNALTNPALSPVAAVFTTSYTYNEADLVTELTYPDGEAVTNEYTERGLPNSMLSDDQIDFVTSATYNALAQLDERTAGNGLVTDYDYFTPLEDNNRLSNVLLVRDSTNLLNLTYGYDDVGNVNLLTDASSSMGGTQTHTFVYDHLDRLIDASVTGGTATLYDLDYTYNKIGNLTNRDGDSYTYGQNGAGPHAVTAVGSDSYSYDSNGNMITRTEAAITYTQDWTEFNKLERVSWDASGNTYTTTFVYDGDGNRILRIEDVDNGSTVTETTTLYIGQIYEREVDTTSNDLAVLDITISGGQKGLFASLFAAYSFTDEFGTLDTTKWTVITTNNVSLLASSSPSQLDANRASTFSSDWGDFALITLKQGVNFEHEGSTVEWKVRFNGGSIRSVMHMRVRDADAQRYIALDCSTGDTLDADFPCVASIRRTDISSQPTLTSTHLGTFTQDTFYNFKMVLTDTRTVEFYNGTTLLGSLAFDTTQWNGMDWVNPEWLVTGWSGFTNTISSSLDYFAFTSDDSSAPAPIMKAEPTTTSGVENEVSWFAVTDPGYGGPVTYQAEKATSADFNSGIEASAWLSGLTHTFENLMNDTTYYYRVKAKDGLGNISIPSNVVSSKQIVAPSGGETSVRKYYYHGGQRVAMRQGNTVYYLHSDHLGSTSLTTSFTQSTVHQARFLPFGGERWDSGTGTTDFTFTGQRVEAGFGLHDYNARFYSSRLGRFISPDPVVPGASDPQAWNRYSYVANNPLRYIDPSGNCAIPAASDAPVFMQTPCDFGGEAGGAPGPIITILTLILVESMPVIFKDDRADTLSGTSTGQPRKRPTPEVGTDTRRKKNRPTVVELGAGHFENFETIVTDFPDHQVYAIEGSQAFYDQAEAIGNIAKGEALGGEAIRYQFDFGKLPARARNPNVMIAISPSDGHIHYAEATRGMPSGGRILFQIIEGNRAASEMADMLVDVHKNRGVDRKLIKIYSGELYPSKYSYGTPTIVDLTLP